MARQKRSFSVVSLYLLVWLIHGLFWPQPTQTCLLVEVVAAAKSRLPPASTQPHEDENETSPSATLEQGEGSTNVRMQMARRNLWMTRQQRPTEQDGGLAPTDNKPSSRNVRNRTRSTTAALDEEPNHTRQNVNRTTTPECQALQSKLLGISQEEEASGTSKRQHRRPRFMAWLLRTKNKKHSRKGIMNMAYNMAVLSALCYWDYLGPFPSSRNDKKNRTQINWPYDSPHKLPNFRLQSFRHEKALDNTNGERIGTLLPRQRFLWRFFQFQICYLKRLLSHLFPFGKLLDTTGGKPLTCRQILAQRWYHREQHSRSNKSTVMAWYYLYDWHEPSPMGNYHDTDLLLATVNGGRTLIVAFAGTETAADTITNVQTFEPVSHSGFFHGGRRHHNRTVSDSKNHISNHGNSTRYQHLEGSIHRGFLNALTRVERGWILRFGSNRLNALQSKEAPAIATMDQEYINCTRSLSRGTKDQETNDKRNSRKENPEKKHQKRHGCHNRNVRLVYLLRGIVIDNLQAGRTVHLTGHSLGGGLATLLAMDILINFPDVPVKHLRLWTFGAPQVADEAFYQSAVEIAPRFGEFFSTDHSHRFVTLSDQCFEDIVANVAQRALAPQKRNLWGKAFRKLGGVRGSVVHFNEPHFLLTPKQFEEEIFHFPKQRASNSSTKSAVSAHRVHNYLGGISRESGDHPLSTNLPDEVRTFIGEAF